MGAPEALWADFLPYVANGQTRDILDWREVSERFRVIVTTNVKTVDSVVYLKLDPHDPLLLGRQGIDAPNKLVNQVNHDFHQSINQEAQNH
jgi:hypothetical protein